jgi:hypothetical protein
MDQTHDSGLTKEELRNRLASMPFDAKLEILDKLRERNLAIAEAREQLRRKLASEKKSEER